MKTKYDNGLSYDKFLMPAYFREFGRKFARPATARSKAKLNCKRTAFSGRQVLRYEIKNGYNYDL